jgi:PTS system nitrogen regulatory IIA component
MQLMIRDLAKALQVNENIVYRWISDEQLPAELINGQYYFNKAQVLEWATMRKIKVPPSFFQSGNGNGGGNLEQALRAGGIHYDLVGTDKESALRSVALVMPFPNELDRDFIYEVLLSRESLGSTGVGDGVAIPHPRYPMVLPVPHPFITLCFLRQAIPYSAADARAVHTLFALVCPTVHMHLGLVAQLASALSDPEFQQAILKRAPAEQIFQVASRFRGGAKK